MARSRKPPHKRLYFKDVAVTMDYEECPRISSCQLCSMPILAGTNRVTLFGNLRNPVKQHHGGSIFKKRWFFHPECLKQWIGEDYPSPYTCCDCGIALEVPAGNIHVRRGAFRYLCVTCVRLDRWRHCNICKSYAHRHEASPIIQEGIVTDWFCCDRCEEHEGVWTVKARKRARRTNG